MQRTDGTFHVSNKFNDISGATPGTVIEQKFLNTVQEELINAVSMGMDPVAAGTLESAPAYRDTQLSTLLKLIIAGQWHITTASAQQQQSGIIESQTGIASDGSNNMAICRYNPAGAVSLVNSDNYGLIFYQGVSDSNIRQWSAIEYGSGVFIAIAEQGGAADVNRVARYYAGSWSDIGPAAGSGIIWYGISTDGAGNWVICGYQSGSGNRVYYTTNNGNTWFPATTTAVHTSTYAWFASAYGAGTFMIGGQDNATGNPLIYLSTDGGDNWTAASTPPGGDRNVSALAYHQVGSSGEWIAAMGDYFTTRDRNIYRSFGSGDTWSAIQLPLGINEQFYGNRARVFDDMVLVPGYIDNLVGDSFPVLLKYTDVNNHFSFVHIPASDLAELHDIAKAKEGYITVGRSTTASNYDYMVRSANIA